MHSQRSGHSVPNFRDIEAGARDMAQFALLRTWSFTLSEPGKPPGMFAAHRVSPGYFDVLGIQPELGRVFRPDEDAPGANRVIVLSHAFWQMRFDGDPNIVGRVVRIDGEPTEIVGVLPANAAAPSLWGQVWIYRPLGLTPEELDRRLDNQFRIIGRYRAGVSPAEAKATFAAVGARLAADHPAENPGMGLRAVSLQSTSLDPDSRNLTFLLLGLSGFVLLIACGNLANLMLARALARSRELAIRAALGASRGQLIGTLAGECLLLGVIGGAMGVLVSAWVSELLARHFGGGDPAIQFALDGRVLGFAVGAALLTSLAFGLIPAWLASRLRVNETLKGSARGSTGDRSQQRFRALLIVGQFALALVLLAGAAVFVRGLDQLIKRDAGWQPAGLVTGKLTMPMNLVADSDRVMRFYREVQQHLAALPGVESASVDVELPLLGYPGPVWFEVEGRDNPPPGRRPMALKNPVSPEFFRTTGVALRQGRLIAPTDRGDSPWVFVINEAMARAIFPEGDAIGHRLRVAGMPEGMTGEIVGIVDDVRFINVTAERTPFQLYAPLTKETWGFVSVTVRASSPSAAAALVAPMQRAVAELDPDIAFTGVMPVAEVAELNLADVRFISRLLTGFAFLGLLLAALGIYGVTTRTVLQRTGEIGIRLALGAQGRDIMRLIVGGGARLARAGAGIGLFLAIGLTTALARALPGLADGGAAAIAPATGVLVAVTLLACWLPARRAARVDPLVALRAE
jgi:predicted permease